MELWLFLRRRHIYILCCLRLTNSLHIKFEFNKDNIVLLVLIKLGNNNNIYQTHGRSLHFFQNKIINVNITTFYINK